MSLSQTTTPNRRQGAASARRGDLDPIDLVSRIMQANPTAGIDEICRLARKALDGKDSRYQDSFNDYCTRNHFLLLSRRDDAAPPRLSSKPKKPNDEQQASKIAAGQRAAEAIDAIKQIVLMELPTPFDKPLGDLTESEGQRLSGWYAALFVGIGNKKLREAKTEADLQQAWRQRWRSSTQ